MNCWKDKAEHMAELHGFGSQEWAEAMAEGGGTCLLGDGHDGPHEFTPDDKISIEFTEGQNPSHQGTRLVPRTLDGVVQFPNHKEE